MVKKLALCFAVVMPSEASILSMCLARDNLIFLQRWFDKFPQYRHMDLFITGESYAGNYVPQLAKLMIQFNENHKLFNLKGVALGNPVLEFSTDFNSQAEYFWSHGLISETGDWTASVDLNPSDKRSSLESGILSLKRSYRR